MHFFHFLDFFLIYYIATNYLTNTAFTFLPLSSSYFSSILVNLLKESSQIQNETTIHCQFKQLKRSFKALLMATSQLTYHVFLSRGDDTRWTFSDHLYTALFGSGFRTFVEDDDDELIQRGGNTSKLELKRVLIKQSRSSIIVFSKDYVYSDSCLDELVMILEHKRESKHVVLPVFYDLDPSHVRKQMGIVEEAFSMHEARVDAGSDERKNKYESDKVEGWRAALREVADLAGMVLQNQADGFVISS
ncbi:hypothetical protein CsSME_00010384 [Camellia sinensis var. sinensis]